MSKYVALSVESKLYSVCSRNLSLKSVGEGEVEYWLSISPIALEISLSLESLWKSIQLFSLEDEEVNLRGNTIFELVISLEEGVESPIM